MKAKEKKVVLVTGASSGIGYETALLLARQGHKVYAAARRYDLLRTLSDEDVTPFKLDVTDEASMAACVKHILDTEGHIDVLINNAGYGYLGALENVTMEEARRQLEVNVFGLARMCQLVLPSMRERGKGRIINISSVAGKAVLYFGGWYNVSKFSVEALSDALRMETKSFGIDVVIVEPGGIKTNWGFIAADHLAENSKGTPYEQEALSEAKAFRKAYSMRLLSDPAVVSGTIAKAVNCRRPRTRYRVGIGSSAIVFFHALLPTRWWDGLSRLLGKVKI
ncbi:MAG: SDR family NAD(P)-dependent oxidoreductase [Oscillospiraceae bacterium]|nr:SDR family NAD(P)-dependent oxidoreductase [Oscillospiraceae bacterium]